MPELLLFLLIVLLLALYADIWLVPIWGYKKFGVLLLVGGLATAVIYLGDLSSPVDLGLTILSCVVLLLIAPLYAIVGFCILLASISGQDLTIQNCATFLIVGYVWCFTKLCGYALNDSAKNEKRAREEEKRQHLHAEKSEFERVFNQYPGPSEALLARLENCNDSPLTVNYFYIESDCHYDDCYYSYAGAVRALRDRQRKRQQREQENLELSSAFEAFITTCEEPWDELMRTGAAFGG
jgi:hypothetical protein